MSNKRKLGMGLSMLLGSNSLEMDVDFLKDMSFVNLDILKIKINPNQPRKHFDQEKLNELSQSIVEYGVLQPILVKKNKEDEFIIVAGERRYRACLKAGLEKIPAIILTEKEENLFQKALIENIQRENLNVIEEANAYRVIINDLNCTHDELAKKVGKSRSDITNKIRILSLPEVVVECIRSGSISFGHAKVLLSVNNPIDYCDLIIKENLSIRQLESLISIDKLNDINIRNVLKNDDLPNLSIDKKVLTEIENGLKKITNFDIKIAMNEKGDGKVMFSFKSAERLQEIVNFFFNYDK
jgi:ParB family chromosome partitioning protein